MAITSLSAEDTPLELDPVVDIVETRVNNDSSLINEAPLVRILETNTEDDQRIITEAGAVALAAKEKERLRRRLLGY